jgi:hypothetical protein
MKYKTLQEIADKWLDKTVPYPAPDPYRLQGQCVQFVRYCLDGYYQKPQWAPVAGAADFWPAYERDPSLNGFWDKIPNTPDFVPQEGDVCVWNKNKGGGYGHIGVVCGPKQSVSTFTCLESNWKPLKVSVVTHDYNDVLGFFRARR